ncbi:multicopper oxidase-domain-containing protein, partial [Lasiosphaeris hirsuta]
HPPSAPDGSNFTCNYTAMKGWSQCSNSTNRDCWLADNFGNEFNITTNYEGTVTLPDGSLAPLMPTGVLRKYNLTVTNGIIPGNETDGLDFDLGKWFNEQYPGPWIQGCWGDTFQINITNKLQGNGTSIHWHGIRQWLTMHMDGVNGVTQCPIAPNDYFVYTFKATQYGSSWYHSHYSIQYADGLVGPITIHGPSSQPYDIAPDKPLLLTDWAHNSAFEVVAGADMLHPSILLNGIGNVNAFGDEVVPPSQIPTPYTLYFEAIAGTPLKYLLRVINTSFQTPFVFSIDNHMLHVVQADFVPIKGYYTSNVHIGIGQRYQIIVEAQPEAHGYDELPADGNYWIRTHIINNCPDTPAPDNDYYMQTGILRYDNTSTATPTSQPWPDLDLNCTEEPLGNLEPKVPWTVTHPSNNGSHGESEDISFRRKPNITGFPLAKFALNPTTMQDWTPLRVDYGNPTFLNLNNTGPWNASSMVILEDNLKSSDYIFLEITSLLSTHPIHLHGHDFAIISKTDPNHPSSSFSISDVYNPPRRDVILVPEGGSVLIAFHADNPGAWLVHCHIAAHAAMGLGLQILERRADAQKIWPSNVTSPALREAERVCRRWNDWQANCQNWWHG